MLARNYALLYTYANISVVKMHHIVVYQCCVKTIARNILCVCHNGFPLADDPMREINLYWQQCN